MPNGKPGDHPFTDIVVHGSDVYSPHADELIRKIAALAPTAVRRKLADLLFEKYDNFSSPNIPELELYLESLYTQLTSNES